MQTWQQGFTAPECQNIALPKDVHPDRGSLVSKFASVSSSFLGKKKSTKSAFKTSTLPSMAETDFCLEHLQTYRASVSLCLHRQTHQVDPQIWSKHVKTALLDSMDSMTQWTHYLPVMKKGPRTIQGLVVIGGDALASKGLKVKCKKVELCGSRVPSKGFTDNTCHGTMASPWKVTGRSHCCADRLEVVIFRIVQGDRWEVHTWLWKQQAKLCQAMSSCEVKKNGDMVHISGSGAKVQPPHHCSLAPRLGQLLVLLAAPSFVEWVMGKTV